MMQNSKIPPRCGIKTRINRNFPQDLQERRVYIAGEPRPWPRPCNHTRKAFINNFSAAGGNTALLLEDAPVLHKKSAADGRSFHVVAVSAKCWASLSRNASALQEYLHLSDSQQLAHLSYTTTARRIHHPHRMMVYGEDLESIKTSLNHAFTNEVGLKRWRTPPKVVFAFTGQGSAYLGIGQDLFHTSPTFRRHICMFDAISQVPGNPSFKGVYDKRGKNLPGANVHDSAGDHQAHTICPRHPSSLPSSKHPSPIQPLDPPAETTQSSRCSSMYPPLQPRPNPRTRLDAIHPRSPRASIAVPIARRIGDQLAGGRDASDADAALRVGNSTLPPVFWTSAC